MVRLTDRPDMTLDVYRGRKTTMQQQQQCNNGGPYKAFARMYHGDLGFDPTQSNFKSGFYFIKINILTKFHEDWIKTLPSKVYT